jgi:hypothetical protein
MRHKENEAELIWESYIGQPRRGRDHREHSNPSSRAGKSGIRFLALQIINYAKSYLKKDGEDLKTADENSQGAAIGYGFSRLTDTLEDKKDSDIFYDMSDVEQAFINYTQEEQHDETHLEVSRMISRLTGIDIALIAADHDVSDEGLQSMHDRDEREMYGDLADDEMHPFPSN